MPSLAVTLHVEGHELAVLRLSGRARLSELFSFSVAATQAGDDLMLGKPFELDLADDFKVHGIVVAVETEVRQGEKHVELTLGPDVFLLALGQDSAVFREMTAVDIVKKVLANGGVEASATKWSLSSTYAARPYTVQRGESDFAFIERLLAEEGIHYFFEHGPDATVLSFADDSTTAESAGKMHYRMSHGINVAAETAWVSTLRLRTEIAHDSVLVRDRDSDKPALSLEGKAGATTAHTFYEWPGRFNVPADGTTRAKKTLEAWRASCETRTGSSGTPAIRCGHAFEIVEHPNDARNGKVLCTDVAWSLLVGGEALQIEWSAVPLATPWRPHWRDPALRPLGPETVTVTGAASAEIDVDDHGRIVFQPTWDRLGKKDDKASVRTRVGQSALAESMTLPRTGFAMLLSHHDGDVDRPWAQARLTDGAHPPPYKLPDNKTRSAWQTLTSTADGTSTEVRFEDKSDAEELFFNAAKDVHVAIGDNAAWTIGNSDTLEVDGERKTTVSADEKLTVSADQSTTIKGQETLEIDGSRSLTVKGKGTTTIDGSSTEKIASDCTRDIGGAGKLTVGDALTKKGKEGLTREVMKKLTQKSTGAWTTQTDQMLTVTVIGDATDKVDGASSETGKNGVQTLVAGDMKESITAGYTITAQGGLGESAKGKLEIKASAGITATAATIEISADSEITIVCGASTLTIKSDGVEVKSAAITCTGPMIVNDGATVKHNP